MKKKRNTTGLRFSKHPMAITPMNKIVRLGCMWVASLMAMMAIPANAAVTPYSWLRMGENAGSVFADSSGTAHPFGAAFSSGCCCGAGGGGLPAAVLSSTAAGGPLGVTGQTSTIGARWGFYTCGNSGMWIQGANNTVPTPAQWSLPATNWVMECWVLPQNDGRSGGPLDQDGVGAQFMSTGTGHFGGTPRGAAFRTTYDAASDTVIIRADAIGPDAASNFQIGDTVASDKTKWIHVAVVNDAGVFTFYTNGVACGASTNYNTGEIVGTVPYIGSGQDTGAPFDGYLDECRYSTFAPGAFVVADLLLAPPGPSFISQPESTAAWEGGTAPFRVTTAFDASTTYQWRSNNVNITGATGSLYVKPSLALADSGTSNDVVVTASSISKTSSVATLTVLQNNPANVAAYRNLIIADPSLVAYFPVDDNTGVTVTNVEDATRHGTLELSAIYDGRTNRAFGQRAVSFYGDGDVQIPNNPAFEFPSGNGTIEALVYLDPTALVSPTDGTIFSLTTDGGTPNYYFLRAGASGLNITYGNDSTAQLSWDVPGGLASKQTHVVIVFNNTTNVTLYANGQNLGTKVQTSFGTGTGSPAWIGSMGSTATANWLYGSVDELAIYNSALSENTVQIHYSSYFFGTNTAPPSVVSQSPSKTLYAGASPVLKATATGTLPLSYGWYSNGVPIPGANSPTLALSNVTVTTSYTLGVTNAYGSTNGQPIVLTFIAPPSPYSAAVAADGPTAYWRLNEASGTTAFDVAGFNDATYFTPVNLGAASVIANETDPAVDFATGSGRAQVDNVPELNPNGPFTLEAWTRPNAGASGIITSSQNRNNSRGGYSLHAGIFVPQYGIDLGAPNANVTRYTSTTLPAAGVPVHLVFTYDGTNGWFYVNGQLQASGPLNNYVNNTVAPLTIGKRSDNNAPWNGVVDEVAFYSYALSQTRITNHWSYSWVPAAVTQQPVGTNTTELSTITLTASASGYPNTYQWVKDNAPLDGTKTNFDGTLHYPGGVTSPTLTIAKTTIADAGQYHLVVNNPVAGAQTSPDVTVAVTADTTPPVAETAASMDGATVDICFDEFLDPGGFDPGADPGTARNAANYTFVSPGGATVTSAELRKNGKAVRLTVTGLSPATAFTIKVANVIDWSRRPANAIPAAGQNVSGTVQTLLTTSVDIDAAVAGTTYSCNPGEYEVEAGGVDIWGASDTFHFDYKEVTGDFDVRAQIAEVTNPGNRSGIMLRESTAADSRFNYITFNPGNLLAFHVRETAGVTPIWANPPFNNWQGVVPPPNVWMRLKREGDVTSAFRSTDGVNWIAFGTTTNVIADPALLGLATAANAGANTGYTRYVSYGTTPGVLNISNQGGVLTLSWSGPGVLKSSTSVTGPYTPEASQSNPQVVQPTGDSKFFRLE